MLRRTDRQEWGGDAESRIGIADGGRISMGTRREITGGGVDRYRSAGDG